jgi:hypothetical protein
MTTEAYYDLAYELNIRGFEKRTGQKIQEEDFYWFKNYCGYQLFFLVYDFGETGRKIPENSVFGITPYIIAEGESSNRLDVFITTDTDVAPDSIDAFEEYAKRFYDFFRRTKLKKKKRPQL